MSRTVAVGVALAAMFAGARGLAAQKKEATTQPTFVGTWAFNASKSDDPREKMAEAMRPRVSGAEPPPGGSVARGGRGGASGRRPTTGAGAGSGANGGGTGGGGGEGRGGPGGMRAMQSFMRNPQKLVIQKTDSSFIIQRDELPALELPLDGHELKFGSNDEAGNTEVKYKAQWKGDKLTVETHIGDGTHADETYEVKNNVLQVETRLTGSRLPAPVKFKRVFDPAAG